MSKKPDKPDDTITPPIEPVTPPAAPKSEPISIMGEPKAPEPKDSVTVKAFSDLQQAVEQIGIKLNDLIPKPITPAAPAAPQPKQYRVFDEFEVF